MYLAEWFLVSVLVTCVVGSPLAGPGEEALKDLTQTDSEVILSGQTILRRYLIAVIANIREKSLPQDQLHSAVDRIIQGLHSRDLDPLKAVQHEVNHPQYMSQSIILKMAKILHNLQGCGEDGASPQNWYFFLQAVPGIDAMIPPLPSLILNPRHFDQINRVGSPYVLVVLVGIQKLRFRITGRLLADILFNYRFSNYSPDVNAALDNIIQLLEKKQLSFQGLQMNPTANKSPSEVLSDILKYVLRKQKVESGLSYQIDRLLSALSETVENPSDGLHVWSCLDLLSGDDYPPDVIQAKDDLVLALKNHQLGVDWKRMSETLRGYSPLEKVLWLVSKLTMIPSENPLARKIQAIHTHVKLRYLRSKEKFFYPQTASDMAFLLNSFLTLKNEANPSLINEIHRIFLLPQYQWRRVLATFNFSKYSRPRSLVIDILQELLNNSNKLPECDLTILNYFIGNNSKTEIPGCSKIIRSDDILTEGPVPTALIENASTSAPFPSLLPTLTPQLSQKQCLDGPPSRFIDPDSIIEIINSNVHIDFISALIRNNPMPGEKYSTETRAAIYNSVLEELKDSKYSDSVSALMRLPLNEKANLPPRHVYKCPEEIPHLKTKGPPPNRVLPVALSSTLASSLSCSNPVLIIDQETLIDIASKDKNYEQIKSIVTSEPICHEEFKMFTTREEVLKAVLEKKKESMANRSDITQIIPGLVVSEDGKLQPLTVEACPEWLATSSCPPNERPGLRDILPPLSSTGANASPQQSDDSSSTYPQESSSYSPDSTYLLNTQFISQGPAAEVVSVHPQELSASQTPSVGSILFQSEVPLSPTPVIAPTKKASNPSPTESFEINPRIFYIPTPIGNPEDLSEKPNMEEPASTIAPLPNGQESLTESVAQSRRALEIRNTLTTLLGVSPEGPKDMDVRSTIISRQPFGISRLSSKAVPD